MTIETTMGELLLTMLNTEQAMSSMELEVEVSTPDGPATIKFCVIAALDPVREELDRVAKEVAVKFLHQHGKDATLISYQTDSDGLRTPSEFN